MQNWQLSKTSYSLFTVFIGIFIFMAMGALAISTINIALPTISDLFGISMGTSSLVAIICLLIMAGSILITRKKADIIGFENIFITGISIFSTASLLCGFLLLFTQSFETLFPSRVIQAIGGVMLVPVTPAMINVNLSQEIEGKNMDIIMSHIVMD
jgi:MFS family permease